MSDYSVQPVEAVPEAAKKWGELADRSPDAWFWHTWANMQFNFTAGQKSKARNLSFFVLRDGQPIGMVPLCGLMPSIASRLFVT